VPTNKNDWKINSSSAPDFLHPRHNQTQLLATTENKYLRLTRLQDSFRRHLYKDSFRYVFSQRSDAPVQSSPYRYLLILGLNMRLADIPSLEKQGDSDVIEDGDLNSSIVVQLLTTIFLLSCFELLLVPCPRNLCDFTPYNGASIAYANSIGRGV
jgi:hypothetical protein